MSTALKCPLCGSTDPEDFLIYLAAWFRWPEMVVDDTIQLGPPGDDDTVECQAEYEDPAFPQCNYRAPFKDFAACGAGEEVPVTDHSAEHGGDPPPATAPVNNEAG